MLIKPSNYDEVEVKEFEFVPLEVGGHKCLIKKVEEYTSPVSGKTSLKVEIDTDTTDKQPNYFQKQFDNDTREDKKWSNGAIKYVPLGQEENQVRMLKAFITAVENSNNGFKFDWNKDVNQLINKKIGATFGLEEYQANDGTTKTATKVRDFRSYDKVDNVQIPKVKTLDNKYVDYDEYKENKKEDNSNPFEEFGDVVEITDNLLD